MSQPIALDEMSFEPNQNIRRKVHAYVRILWRPNFAYRDIGNDRKHSLLDRRSPKTR